MNGALWGGASSEDVLQFSAAARIRRKRRATAARPAGVNDGALPQCLPRVEPIDNSNSSNICSMTCDMPNYMLKHDTDLHAQNSAVAAGRFLVEEQSK
jgi:hypothetical protein